MLEIEKVLTVSAGHVTKETYETLRDDADVWINPDYPVIYTKGQYGVFINVPEDYIAEKDGENECSYPNLPLELYTLMNLAFENDCRWLCLDCDGPLVEGIEVYDDDYL